MILPIKLERLLVLFVLLFSFNNLVKAQPSKGEFIKAAIGFGITASEDELEDDVTGHGIYIQGEYVIGLASWFSFRPYLGFISTKTDDDLDSDLQDIYELSTTAVYFGGKGRVIAPIPYVAPYIELGIGTSIGSFRTLTPFSDIDKTGVLLHVPVSLGVAVGRKNNIEIEFTYLFHDTADQVSGGAGIGVSFPIEKL